MREPMDEARERARALREALRAAKRGRRTATPATAVVATLKSPALQRATGSSRLAEPAGTREALDVMLSYAHADRQPVGALRRALIADGYRVWWDGDIPPGESYRSFIAARIRTARATVVVWSPASIASEFVIDEAELARSLGRLLPVHLDGFDLGSIPLGLGQRHAVPLARYDVLAAALGARGIAPAARTVPTAARRR